MGCSKSSSKRGVYSKLGLPQEIKEISNKLFNFTPKKPEKEQMKEQEKKPNISRREIRISVEINEVETKKAVEKNQ